MFTFSADNLACGCADAQMLIRSGVGLIVGWSPVAQYKNITEKNAREGRVPLVHMSDCEGVLITHELVGALLPFSGKIVIGEIVAVRALMSSAVGAIDDGEGGGR